MILKGHYNNIWGDPTIHLDAQIGAYTEIGSTPEYPTSIGKCKIQAKAFIPPGVTIEDDVFIGPGVMFANDKNPKANGVWAPMKTIVRKGASIGMGALIGPGVDIGEGAVIGMGSVVLSNVPPGEVWVGIPARRLDRTP